MERSFDVGLRASALNFVNGARSRWSMDELLTWMDQSLIRTFREAGVGIIANGRPNDVDGGAGFLPHDRANDLIRTAHQKVVATLSAYIGPSADDRFVQAAIYAGRVTRGVSSDGVRKWHVLLSETVNLSEQVLAIFAADILQHPDDYQESLVVCEACGGVLFWPRRLTKNGCPDHPQGLIGVPTIPNMRAQNLR
jgi:hypothetical protein